MFPLVLLFSIIIMKYKSLHPLLVLSFEHNTEGESESERENGQTITIDFIFLFMCVGHFFFFFVYTGIELTVQFAKR